MFRTLMEQTLNGFRIQTRDAVEAAAERIEKGRRY